MKVAVISDTHDNVWKLAKAMPHLAAADAVIHCGDLVSPSTVRDLAKGVGNTPIHIVWGNNETDKSGIERLVEEFPHVTHHGMTAEIELQGLKVAACHYLRVAQRLASSGLYDMVCYGHKHKPHEEWIGDCLLLNPGEVMGMRGPSTIALVDLPERSVEWIDL